MLRPPATARTPAALPRAPVLDWSSFRGDAAANAPAVQDLARHAYTTSGRAAIFHALRLLNLPDGSEVLVPTYHCPTMVAPVVRAGLKPTYFALQPDGLPDLAALARAGAPTARAIIVAHYFGLPVSLAEVRRWCDGQGIALIEDCAHCFFGQAGERPVGGWGDYATASLSKFFPVPEAGLLGSSTRVVGPLSLRRPSARAQAKGWVDVLEFAALHGRLRGLRPLLALLFALKNRRIGKESPSAVDHVASVEVMMRDCDMARVDCAPLAASLALEACLPRATLLARRRANYAAYQRAFATVAGARPLFPVAPLAAAPYVFPLWVDDADRVYRAIRAAELPVFRWDRQWPGTPQLTGDAGGAWSRHVLQLLCHQDLRPVDIARTIVALGVILAATPAPASVGAVPSRLAA